MPQIVPPQVLISEAGDHLVPVRRIAQDGGSGPPASGASEQPGTWIWADAVEATGNQLAAFFNGWHLSCPLALGGFVDQSAWARCGLTTHGPNPSPSVDISPADTRHLANPRSRARSESDNLTPARPAGIRVASR
jgi:hypothetical protein